MTQINTTSTPATTKSAIVLKWTKTDAGYVSADDRFQIVRGTSGRFTLLDKGRTISRGILSTCKVDAEAVVNKEQDAQNEEAALTAAAAECAALIHAPTAIPEAVEIPSATEKGADVPGVFVKYDYMDVANSVAEAPRKTKRTRKAKTQDVPAGIEEAPIHVPAVEIPEAVVLDPEPVATPEVVVIPEAVAIPAPVVIPQWDVISTTGELLGTVAGADVVIARKTAKRVLKLGKTLYRIELKTEAPAPVETPAPVAEIVAPVVATPAPVVDVNPVTAPLPQTTLNMPRDCRHDPRGWWLARDAQGNPLRYFHGTSAATYALTIAAKTPGAVTMEALTKNGILIVADAGRERLMISDDVEIPAPAPVSAPVVVDVPAAPPAPAVSVERDNGKPGTWIVYDALHVSIGTVEAPTQGYALRMARKTFLNMSDLDLYNLEQDEAKKTTAAARKTTEPKPAGARVVKQSRYGKVFGDKYTLTAVMFAMGRLGYKKEQAVAVWNHFNTGMPKSSAIIAFGAGIREPERCKGPDLTTEEENFIKSLPCTPA